MLKVKEISNGILLEDVIPFSLDDTLDCGQAFRWKKNSDASYSGMICNRLITVRLENGRLSFTNTNHAFFSDTLIEYFDLNTNYSAIQALFSKDPILHTAIHFAPGLRLLRQEPWEALCSFIISQNNHVPRIKGIIDRLCLLFGEKTEGGFTFPAAEVLCHLKESDLMPLRAGFRASYILDAAKKVADGSIDFSFCRTQPLASAREHLMAIRGVGPKVADCTLLYGLGRIDAFPLDVWMKRVSAAYYPNGLPEEFLPYAGIAQQYLFHWARTGAGTGKKAG